MSTSVRIVRAAPAGPITRPDAPVPIVATIHWHRGGITEVEATASAWSDQAVEVEWRSQHGLRRDWIPAQHVRRPGQSPVPQQSLPSGPRKRNRW
jgi:hypothetical protein